MRCWLCDEALPAPHLIKGHFEERHPGVAVRSEIVKPLLFRWVPKDEGLKGSMDILLEFCPNFFALCGSCPEDTMPVPVDAHGRVLFGMCWFDMILEQKSAGWELRRLALHWRAARPGEKGAIGGIVRGTVLKEWRSADAVGEWSMSALVPQLPWQDHPGQCYIEHVVWQTHAALQPSAQSSQQQPWQAGHPLPLPGLAVLEQQSQMQPPGPAS